MGKQTVGTTVILGQQLKTITNNSKELFSQQQTRDESTIFNTVVSFGSG